MKGNVVFTIGLPGAGKTTWAKEMQKIHNAILVNRASIGMQLFGYTDGLSTKEEAIVSSVQNRMIHASVNLGRLVIVDNTNLNKCLLYNDIKDIASIKDVEVYLKYFSVDVQTAIDRQEHRPDKEKVSSDEILRIYNMYIYGQDMFVPNIDVEFDENGYAHVTRVFKDVYQKKSELPPAYIFDIDGTLALNTEGRHIFDYSRVKEDECVSDVASMARDLHRLGHTIIIMTGRTDDSKVHTEKWLRDNNVPYDSMFMREKGDRRPDAVVKKELFDTHVKDSYNVLGWFDDRMTVSKFIHDYGITLYRVGNPEWWF